MGRIMAIDYGQKRIGLAVTDPDKIIANGLDTVAPHELMKYLSDYVAKEPVERFVVGLPKRMDGQPSDSMRLIEPFVKGLKRNFPDIPVEYFDERFTSVLAHKAIIDAGISKKQRKEDKKLVDRVSAVIILQSYMESLSFKSL